MIKMKVPIMLDSYYLKSFDKSATSNNSLSQQVYDYILQGILNNEIQLGAKIPSSRNLAVLFGVSRNTILSALEILISEGLATTSIGSGTYITNELTQIQNDNTLSPSIIETGNNLFRTRSHTGHFALGLPDIQYFPQAKWAKAMKSGITSALYYSNKSGHLEFKKQVVDYVKHFRGISCTVENIVPLSSAQAGFDLALKTLLKDKSTVLLEDPCYRAIATAIEYNKHSCVFTHAENNTYSNAPMANMAYLAPSHQAPLGHTTSTKKKLSAIQWAKKNKAWILEDDIDSEFPSTQILPPTLYSMSPENIVYIGSFSKVLSPSVKVAFLIAPASIAKNLNQISGITGQEPSVFMQSAIAETLKDKSLAMHIRKMKNIYSERRLQIKQSIKQHMPFAHIDENNHSGLQIVIHLPETITDYVLIDTLRKKGFSCKALSEYCYKRTMNGLHLGFGNTDVKNIDNLIEKISKSCII